MATITAVTAVPQPTLGLWALEEVTRVVMGEVIATAVAAVVLQAVMGAGVVAAVDVERCQYCRR